MPFPHNMFVVISKYFVYSYALIFSALVTILATMLGPYVLFLVALVGFIAYACVVHFRSMNKS